MSKPLQLLNQIYGYPCFQGLQQEVIEHVLSGGSGLVLMPTGGGKSLCYQIPALIFDGLTIVVSPLIALMQDQASALHELGVRKVQHGDFDPAQAEELLGECRSLLRTLASTAAAPPARTRTRSSRG